MLLHCLPGHQSGVGARAANVIHALMNFAVPAFVMITGAIMLDRDEPLRKTLRRALKFLTALFIFGTAGSFLELFFNTRDIAASAAGAVINVLSGQSWDFTWFLYMITGVYLTIPLFRLFVKNADDKSLIYILLILFVFNVVIPCVNGFAGRQVIDFYLPVTSVYAFYLLLGYYLKNRANFTVSAHVCVLAVIACAALFAVCLPDSIEEFEDAGHICGYASPPAAILAFSVYELCSRAKTDRAVIRIIAENAFGIYLVHCFYIHIIHYVLGIETDILKVPIIYAAVFALSFITSYLLRKIKFVKKYVI